MPIILGKGQGGGGGGSGAPSGPAGGALEGTYPNPTLSAPITSPGLTGATAAARFVGGTASGAPASGTFAVGDFTVDQSGAFYVCTVAGSPGTWTAIGASASAADDENLVLHMQVFA